MRLESRAGASFDVTNENMGWCSRTLKSIYLGTIASKFGPCLGCISGPCKSIENSAVTFVVANSDLLHSEAACRRRPSCIGVQRTGGGAKGKFWCHHICTVTKAPCPRLTRSITGCSKQQASPLGFKALGQFKQLEMEGFKDTKTCRLCNERINHASNPQEVHCVIEIPKALQLGSRADPGRRIPSASCTLLAAIQYVPALYRLTQCLCI
jgi:hypothetical protein